MDDALLQPFFSVPVHKLQCVLFLWHPALLYLLMAYCHRWRRRRNCSFGKMSLRWFKNSSSPPQGHTICATLSTCSTADYFPRCSRRKKTRTYFVRWPAAENSKTKKMKLLHYDFSFKILEWDVTPPPLSPSKGQKINGGSSPTMFQNGVWPPFSNRVVHTTGTPLISL